MTQDYEMFEVKQDNPQLVAYIKQIHLQSLRDATHDYVDSTSDLPSEDMQYLFQLLNNKVSVNVYIKLSEFNYKKHTTLLSPHIKTITYPMMLQF